jgi:hypothetical protein
MTPQQFQDAMTELLNSFCDHHAWGPLRTILPHFPMPNGFTDELGALAAALKTVRVQHGKGLTPGEMAQLIELQHAAEAALARTG